MRFKEGKFGNKYLDEVILHKIVKKNNMGYIRKAWLFDARRTESPSAQKEQSSFLCAKNLRFLSTTCD
ncbi:MAG: hypothetical protein HYT72_03335 [Candidatus Aenigmarchaeota archaeon]|nr:hypothetical protein [Candidatus Aenigmarchaeota archaeon]